MNKMKKPDTEEASKPEVDVATPDTEALPEANTAPIAPELLEPVPSADPAPVNVGEAVQEAVADLLEAVTDVIEAVNDEADQAPPELTVKPEALVADLPTLDPDNLTDLIDKVTWLNQPGHRAGLFDELYDLCGARKVYVGPIDEDLAYIVLAGVSGGHAAGLDLQLQNWCQNARQAVALAQDAQIRARNAAADAEATA